MSIDISGLGGGYARLDSMRLDQLTVRVSIVTSIQYSGPTVRVAPYTSIYTNLTKRFRTIAAISGGSAVGRQLRFYTYTSINQNLSVRFRTISSINPAREVGGDPRGPFKSVTATNVPHDDDGAPIFKIGNTKTGEYVDLTGIPFKFVLQLQESQTAQWSLSIMDQFGIYSPLRVDGPYKNLMDERPFGIAGADTGYTPGVGIQHPTVMGLSAVSSDRPYDGQQMENVNQYVTKVNLDVVKELVFNAKIGGKLWNFRGVGTSFSHTRDWETKVFNFAWKGNDHAILLNRDNQNMQTIRSGVKDGYSLSMLGAVSEMLTKYGVRSNLTNILTEDFQVPYMNRVQGSPYDWVTQLLQAVMLEWYMEDGVTFTPYLPPYATPGTSPSFIHDFTQMAVMSENVEGSMQAMYNQVIATRAAMGGTKTYTVDLFDFGDNYSVTFDPPLSAVTHHLDYQMNGFVYNIEYYKGSQLLAVHEVISGSINYGYNTINAGVVIGATSAKFTWAVLPGGFIGTGSPGRVTFKGVEEVEPSVWGGKMLGDAIDQGPANPAPQLRAYAEDLGLIKAYGLRPTIISASPLIPTQAVLQKFVNRMLYKLSRQARRATYKIPLNPFIRPGTVIREIDYTLGALMNPFGSPLIRDRVVQDCTHSISNDPAERFTTYSGTEYVYPSA